MKKNLSFIVPIVGGIDGDTNYFIKNEFYWLPINQRGEKSVLSDIKHFHIESLPTEIFKKIEKREKKGRKFHYDPLLLKWKTSSYGEPITSGKTKAIKKHFREAFDKDGKCLSQYGVKIFFGAKFKDYYKRISPNSKSTGLFIIGGIKINYMGKSNDLIRLFPHLKKDIEKNAHRRRRKTENFFILIGKSFIYDKPVKFAEWDKKSYLVKKSLAPGFGSSQHILRSVHTGKFNRDLFDNIK